jgi:CobQ-like glutamine amidotransferase family enzyme
MSTTLTILELYPEHLAINGDMGNVRVLRRRLELAGYEVEHLVHNPGDALPAKPDFVTIGSGPGSALAALADDVLLIGGTLRDWVADGVPLLAVAGGYHLLGTALTLSSGTIQGAKVFEVTTDATASRVVTGCFAIDTSLGRLIGIENHGALTTLGAAQEPLGSTGSGRGNNGTGSEGAWTRNAIGTHSHGPVLAMNPVLADHLIRTALDRRGLGYETGSEHAKLDDLALQTRRLLAAGTSVEVGTAR